MPHNPHPPYTASRPTKAGLYWACEENCRFGFSSDVPFHDPEPIFVYENASGRLVANILDEPTVASVDINHPWWDRYVWVGPYKAPDIAVPEWEDKPA